MIQIDRKYVNTALLKKYRIEDTQKRMINLGQERIESRHNADHGVEFYGMQMRKRPS